MCCDRRRLLRIRWRRGVFIHPLQRTNCRSFVQRNEQPVLPQSSTLKDIRATPLTIPNPFQHPTIFSHTHSLRRSHIHTVSNVLMLTRRAHIHTVQKHSQTRTLPPPSEPSQRSSILTFHTPTQKCLEPFCNKNTQFCYMTISPSKSWGSHLFTGKISSKSISVLTSFLGL